MRKILFLAFLATLFGTAAYADVCLPHWTSRQISFRTNANNTVLDSTFTSWGVGVGPNVDTTAAFPLYRIALESPVQGGPIGADSINIMNFHITPRGGVNAPTASGDSIYVTAQVSQDGRSWQTMTGHRTNDATKIVGGATITNGMIVVEGTSDLNAYALPFVQVHVETGFSTATQGTAATSLQWFGWRFVRFIVVTDAVGAYECQLDYRSQSCNDAD